MANRVQRRAAPNNAAQEAAAKKAATELDVLDPDREVMCGGRKLVVREYRNLEWLRLMPIAKPMIDQMAMAMGQEQFNYEMAYSAIAANIDGLLPMIAQAADIDTEFAASLDPVDGERLLMTWWTVNGRFFTNRAINSLMVARVEAQEAARLASERSTQPSSETATSGAS